MKKNVGSEKTLSGVDYAWEYIELIGVICFNKIFYAGNKPQYNACTLHGRLGALSRSAEWWQNKRKGEVQFYLSLCLVLSKIAKWWGITLSESAFVYVF